MVKVISCIVALLIVLSLSACEDKQTVNYSITEIAGKSYTPPDRYEVLYRTVYSNGMTAEHWEQVSKEEYEREVNDER
jgi:uncharacterized lipoprotein YehR (DUF1307 family)